MAISVDPAPDPSPEPVSVTLADFRTAALPQDAALVLPAPSDAQVQVADTLKAVEFELSLSDADKLSDGLQIQLRCEISLDGDPFLEALVGVSSPRKNV